MFIANPATCTLYLKTRRKQGSRRDPIYPETQSTEGHDDSIVEGNGQNHEGREVELVGESEDGETDDNTDGDSVAIDRVVPHMLENDTGTMDGVNDGRETGLGQDDAGNTASSVGSAFDDDTEVGTGQSRDIVDAITSHGAQGGRDPRGI